MPTSPTLRASPNRLANGDGRSDTATLQVGVNPWLSTGTGFGPEARSYWVGTGPTSLAVGDFNNDGAPDVVSLDNAQNRLLCC